MLAQKDNMKVSISVVITTYKRPVETLRRAVLSVCAQKRQPDELIVVNDFPEDVTLSGRIEEMLKEIRASFEIRYYAMPHNGGAAAARNEGLRIAKGQYIAFLDDDDVWNDNKLMLQEKALRDNPDAVLVTGYISSVESKGKRNRNRIYNEGMEYSGDVFEKLLGNNFVGGCSVPLFDRKMALKCGGFDSKTQPSEDHDLWTALSQKGKVVFLREKLITYYLHDQSLTGDFDKRIDGWKAYYKKWRDEFNLYREAKSTFFSIIAIECASNGYGKRAWSYFRRVVNSAGYDKHSIFIMFKIMRLLAQRRFGL